MYITRRKHYSILRKGSSTHLYEPLDSSTPSPRSSNEFDLIPRPNPHPPKTRTLFGLIRIQTPNSSRFSGNLHSRILQKFPFLVEMFYWGIALGFYRLTNVAAQWHYGGRKEMWDSAQTHGLFILNIESWLWGGDRRGPERWLEWRIQRWLLHGAEAGDWRVWLLTILNRGYALIHIPATAGFIAYYYTTAPTHSRFCTVRRSMTLTNFIAFFVFILLPTMPPRLLPEKYGFVDTVNLESATSVWMDGEFVNKLAAFPSMHFGYAFCIGAVLVADSGVLNCIFSRARRYALRGNDESDEADEDQKLLASRTPLTRACLFAFGVWYPSWILLTIVGTANHYFIDAIAAVFVAAAGYWFNRSLIQFLPLEDYMLYLCRMEKPIPTTGRKKNLAVE